MQQSTKIKLIIAWISVSIVFVMLVADDVKFVDLRRETCELECSEPKSRAIRISVLVNSDDQFLPHMTSIVFRCDEGSGCCLKGSSCQMVNYEYLDIKVFSYTQHKLVTFRIQNHTECGCQSIIDDIK